MRNPRPQVGSLATLAMTLLAACTPGAPRAADDGGGPSGVLAHAVRIEHLDTLVREPMLVEHPGGALFVAGYKRVRPALWRSRDRGTTWHRVDLGTAAEGAVGNSDVDLAVAPDGTLYCAQMTFDNTVFEGRGIAVGVSRDTGATWRWSSVSQARFDDRPWIAVAADGTAHLVWNDDRGVQHARSTDRGATWTRTGRVHPRGGSSHLAMGPGGEIAVRVAPGAASGNQCHPDTELVVVSTDGGTTWRAHRAPGTLRADGCPGADAGEIPRWVDPLAWDAGGALHTLWTDSTGVWLARSVDRGATWRTWRVVERGASEPVAHYPFLAARGDGELMATWFVDTGDPLSWRAAWLTPRGPHADAWDVRLSPVTPLESWRAAPREADEGGEYLAVRFLRDGSVAVVTPIQHHAANRLGFTWWTFGPP